MNKERKCIYVHVCVFMSAPPFCTKNDRARMKEEKERNMKGRMKNEGNEE